MKVLVCLSEWLVPIVIFYIVGFGVLSERPVFDDFLKGAKEGMTTVSGVMPTLIGLMTAIGVLRASGFLETVSEILKTPAEVLGVPVELVPIVFVRMISSSAATGLVLDIYKTYGPDSLIGNIVSIIMGSTETIFYTMSVYFMTAKIGKTRWTLHGALIATIAGIAASIFIGNI
ncbi:MAG: spore maturation protein [Lachnospiraceae bacterium]|nr:spore maturation protein [Lachnospiraceae bacterium]